MPEPPRREGENRARVRKNMGEIIVDVRREMKTANPLLFAEYLKQIDGRRRKGA